MIDIALHESVYFSYAKSLAHPRTSMIGIALCEIYAFFYATSLAHLKTWMIDIAFYVNLCILSYNISCSSPEREILPGNAPSKCIAAFLQGCYV